MKKFLQVFMMVAVLFTAGFSIGVLPAEEAYAAACDDVNGVFTDSGGNDHSTLSDCQAAEIALLSANADQIEGCKQGDKVDLQCLKNNSDLSQLTSPFENFALIIISLVGVAAVLMIAYAAFKYTTSQGDPKATEGAKMQIVAAFIGLVIASLAFLILKVFVGVI